jgi:probable rRNA maturation factor
MSAARGLKLARKPRGSKLARVTRGLKLDLVRASRAPAPARSRMNHWAAAALGRHGAGRELAVRIVAPNESRELNRRWRGKDKPTNVLSFPATGLQAPRAGRSREPMPLGDLVICADVVRREAERDGKRIQAHWAHMIIHGALHLAGYDHEVGDRERMRMERREIAVLRSFGYGNPYL